MPPSKDIKKFLEWRSNQKERTQKRWTIDKWIKWSESLQGHPMPKGEESARWKGDEIKYNSLHLVLRKTIEKPDLCTHCGKTCTRLELCNINGTYNRDPSNYIWLCTKCHRAFDNHGSKVKGKCRSRGLLGHHDIERYNLFFNQIYQEHSAII